MYGNNITHVFEEVAEINLAKGWIRLHVRHDVAANGYVIPALATSVTVMFSDTTPPINPNSSYGSVIITRAKQYIETLEHH